MAQNVIVPVIDLTSAAEGSTTPEYLQKAFSFDSCTTFSASNSTVVIANTTGFYLIKGLFEFQTGGSTTAEGKITLSDGLSVKNVLVTTNNPNASTNDVVTTFEYVVFLGAGDSVSAVSNDTIVKVNGMSRQVADVNGNLVNPLPFNPQ